MVETGVATRNQSIFRMVVTPILKPRIMDAKFFDCGPKRFLMLFVVETQCIACTTASCTTDVIITLVFMIIFIFLDNYNGMKMIGHYHKFPHLYIHIGSQAECFIHSCSAMRPISDTHFCFQFHQNNVAVLVQWL